MTKNRLIRAAILALAVIFCAGLVYYAFLKTIPDLVPLLQSGNEAQIEEYLRTSNHVTGLLCTALLQIVQVISIVLPGPPIQIAAGIVYGTWRSFFVCHLASVLAHTLVFLAVRRLGSRMDQLIPVNKKSSRLDFLLKSDTPIYMTVVACLIPILPNGIIPYVAAKTKIKPLQFSLSIYVGTLLPIFVLCAAGSKIMEGGYLFSGILLAALVIFVILLTKFKDNVLRAYHAFLKGFLKKIR